MRWSRPQDSWAGCGRSSPGTWEHSHCLLREGEGGGGGERGEGGGRGGRGGREKGRKRKGGIEG